MQRDDASAQERGESTSIVEAEVEADAGPVLEVVVGRGVASYVEDHGGRLFVWGEPFGAFDWLKASTQAPEGVPFVRFGSVSEFDLRVSESVLVGGRRIRLARRWPWPARGGVVVERGLTLGSDQSS